MQGQVRQIESWYLQPAEDKEGKYIKLVGNITGGNMEIPFPPNTIRITSAGPIKQIKGCTISTDSGTLYCLGKPHGFHMARLQLDNLVLDEKNPIPAKWIENYPVEVIVEESE